MKNSQNQAVNNIIWTFNRCLEIEKLHKKLDDIYIRESYLCAFFKEGTTEESVLGVVKRLSSVASLGQVGNIYRIVVNFTS